MRRRILILRGIILKIDVVKLQSGSFRMKTSALSHIICRFYTNVIPAKAGIQKNRKKTGSRIKACPVPRYGVRDDRIAINVLILTDI